MDKIKVNQFECFIGNEYISFYIDDEQIGELLYTVGYSRDIASEYGDSVDDFDDSIMRKFDYLKKIVNIEDIFVNRKQQGKKLFRDMLSSGMEILTQKYTQFILRACSDNGFPNDKLCEIYKDVGFIPYQETEEDGIIMYKIN